MTRQLVTDKAIAVVGIACRLPGAADPEAFWRLLRDGEDATSDVPEGRWDADSPRRGGFLDDIDRFDAAFFGISPREAAAMDPQQRLVLELGWEALEDAGIVSGTLSGSPTGVFIGAMWDDYAVLAYRAGTARVGPHTITGLHRGTIANRVSHVLGLRGPSMVVDTGQSSSLVAVHLACESLRSGESQVAIAGGVNLNIAAESAVTTSRFGALSPDGYCYTFDARANGYVRGEGGGVVVLKPLDRALRDGDRVYCVIRGGAVNNDGPSEGLTVPSAAAQEALLREAYARAGVSPRDVGYVELHGTGTRRGDPVEAAALGAAIGRHRAPGNPLRVGSAKTNVGHLEGAAGIVGLVKAALCVRHRRLPPTGPDGPGAVAGRRRAAVRRSQLVRHGRHELPPRVDRTARGRGVTGESGNAPAARRPAGAVRPHRARAARAGEAAACGPGRPAGHRPGRRGVHAGHFTHRVRAPGGRRGRGP
jgi:acyl transferase domain-containing protein